MAVAFVQAAISPDVTGPSTTATATPSAAMTNGNLLIGYVSYPLGITLSSVKDNNGVSATAIIDTSSDNVNNQTGSSYYFKNISGAPTSIVATFSASTGNTRISVQEVSGADTAAPLDVHNIDNNSAANPTTSPTVVTNADGEWIFVGATSGVAVGITMTAGSGYTVRSNGSNAANSISLIDESQIQTTAGSITAAVVNPGSARLIVAIATFKAAAAAAGNKGSTLALMGVG